MVACIVAALCLSCTNPLARIVQQDVKAYNDSLTGKLTLEATPATGSELAANESIVLVFSASMNTSSLALSGDLGSKNLAWSKTKVDNDTVTVAPPADSFWPAGKQKTLIVDGSSQSGISLTSVTLSYSVSSLPSIVATLAPTGVVVTAHETLVITFNDSMDTSTVVLSGDLSGGALSWGTTSRSNDTLTVTAPAGYWPAGESQSLKVNGKDSAGFPMTELSVSREVFRGVCVSDPTQTPTVNDDGTIAHPFRTIQSGIDAAKALYLDQGAGPASVRVGGGTYEVSCSVETPGSEVYAADMKEGVSLYGGYASDMKTRDSGANPSTLQNTDISGSSTNDQNPNRTVNFASGITDTTILDGFTVVSGTTNGVQVGIMCQNASPTISNVKVLGPPSTSVAASRVYGIFLKDTSAPVVDSCTIDPGASQTYIHAVYANGPGTGELPAAVISNCTLSGGQTSGDDAEYVDAISLTRNDATITHNTITGGRTTVNANTNYASNEYACIWILQCHPIIENNTMRLYNSSYPVYGVFEFLSGSDPASVKSNDFDYSSWPYYHDNGNSTPDIDEGNWDSVLIDNGSDTGYLFNPAGWKNVSTAAGLP